MKRTSRRNPKRYFVFVPDGIYSHLEEVEADDPQAETFAAAKRRALAWARQKREDAVYTLNELRSMQEDGHDRVHPLRHGRM